LLRCWTDLVWKPAVLDNKLAANFEQARRGNKPGADIAVLAISRCIFLRAWTRAILRGLSIHPPGKTSRKLIRGKGSFRPSILQVTEGGRQGAQSAFFRGLEPGAAGRY
jgi:hypothetical protein